MKKLIISICLIGASFMAQSQNKSSKGDLKFSGAVELAIPIDDFGDATPIGFGLSSQADYYVSDKVTINLYTGFLFFQGETQRVSGTVIQLPNLNVIPVLAGTRCWLASKFYSYAQLGLSYLNYDGVKSRDFTYALGVGYTISKTDIQLKFSSIDTEVRSLDNLGLRFAYNF